MTATETVPVGVWLALGCVIALAFFIGWLDYRRICKRDMERRG